MHVIKRIIFCIFYEIHYVIKCISQKNMYYFFINRRKIFSWLLFLFKSKLNFCHVLSDPEVNCTVSTHNQGSLRFRVKIMKLKPQFYFVAIYCLPKVEFA